MPRSDIGRTEAHFQVKPSERPTRSSRPSVERAHRPDIDGLRAIAVTLVVAFHAGFPFLPGGFIGVDVFFVISGFLICGSLIDEAATTGRVRLAQFYARRARRLLPASAVVLLFVVVASIVVLPALDRASAGEDVAWASVFLSNVNFAASASDYWSTQTAASPVLHFWSLSLEEQFYILFPLILVFGVLGLRRRRTSTTTRRNALVALLTIVVISLACSIFLSADQPIWSYFGLHTRAWELALGGTVAMLAPAFAYIPRRWSGYLTLAGLAAIVAAAITLTPATTYPGYAALWPVLATCGILAAGCARSARGMQSPLLSSRVAQHVGGISYSWYLWHWPLLVFAAVLFTTSSREVAGSPVGGVPLWIVLTTVALSFVIAAGSQQFIENPVRYWRWLKNRVAVTLAFGAVAIAVTFIAGSALGNSVTHIPTSTTDEIAVQVAKSAQTPAIKDPNTALVLRDDPIRAATARAELPGDCMGEVSDIANCNIGAQDGGRTFALVGDSQALAWSPAFGRAAKDLGWKMFAMAQPACPVADLKLEKWNRPACVEFRKSFVEQLQGLRGLERIFVTRSRVYGEDLTSSTFESSWREGFAQFLSNLGPELASKVTVVRDVPVGRDPFVPACVADAANLANCAWPRTSGDADQTKAEVTAAAASRSRVSHMGVADLICPSKTCYPVDSLGTITYRDNLHISQRFSNSLWRVLRDRLERYV